MGVRKLKEKNIRKLIRLGGRGGDSGSLALTIPKEIADDLGWREKQKVVVNRKGDKLIVEDWKE